MLKHSTKIRMTRNRTPKDSNHSQNATMLLKTTWPQQNAYRVIKDKCTPDKPDTKLYEFIKEKLPDYFNPKPYFTTERVKFHN